MSAFLVGRNSNADKRRKVDEKKEKLNGGINVTRKSLPKKNS